MHAKSNLAVNTPAATADAVYVAFGDADIAMYTHDGKLVWVRRYLKTFDDPKMAWGYAISPLVLDDSGCFPWNHHTGPCYLIGPVCGDGTVFLQLWRGSKIHAIRLAGQGKPPEPVWVSAKPGPVEPSLLYYRGVVYAMMDDGILVALDGKTGNEHYRERLKGTFNSSPVAGDGHVYEQHRGSHARPEGGCGVRGRGRRQRKSGAGRKMKLAFADRLLLTLLYYRVYVTQEFVGFLFEVDKGTVSRQVQELGLCMAGVFRIPERKVRIDPDDPAAVFVDATERPVHRPKGEQRRSYSGKEKRHTLKHQVVVTRKRTGPGEKPKVRIEAVSKGAKRRVHDKKLYDRSGLRIPDGVPKPGGSGYQGSDRRVPEKKSRNGQLSDDEKRSNRALAKERIVAEHGIGKMNIWRIAADRYRNPPRRHTVVMKNVAGLHNRMYG